MGQKASGTVVYQPFEGGIWGIETDDGRQLRPKTDLPEEFRKQGMKVALEFRALDVFSFAMWGETVELISIRSV
jgi:hypothetical protein